MASCSKTKAQALMDIYGTPDNGLPRLNLDDVRRKKEVCKNTTAPSLNKTTSARTQSNHSNYKYNPGSQTARSTFGTITVQQGTNSSLSKPKRTKLKNMSETPSSRLRNSKSVYKHAKDLSAVVPISSQSHKHKYKSKHDMNIKIAYDYKEHNIKTKKFLTQSNATKNPLNAKPEWSHSNFVGKKPNYQQTQKQRQYPVYSATRPVNPQSPRKSKHEARPSPARIIRKKSSESSRKRRKDLEYEKNKIKLSEEEERASFAVKPCVPDQILDRADLYLTDADKGDILKYERIYYVGTKASKDLILSRKVPRIQETNFGIDDERGDYILTPGEHLGFRYQVMDVLGYGSFGRVARCIDHKTSRYVAVKIIRNQKRFHQQALVELKVLKRIKEKSTDEFIIHIQDEFSFRNHLCIAFKKLSMNLYELTKLNEYRGFSLDTLRCFAIQILQGLLILRELNIIHCDLKPENILLECEPQQYKAQTHASLRENQLKDPMNGKYGYIQLPGGLGVSTGIKLIDFGSACFMNDQIFTYIQSRFYRSPEVMLGIPYDFSIDMWSVGCILGELANGLPIFPGENEKEQMACIMEACGIPPKHVLKNASRSHLFFEDSTYAPLLVQNTKTREKRIPGTKDISLLVQNSDRFFRDFLKKSLAWDPEKRLTPKQGLQHKWICNTVGGS